MSEKQEQIERLRKDISTLADERQVHVEKAREVEDEIVALQREVVGLWP